MKPFLPILASLFCAASFAFSATVRIGGSDMIEEVVKDAFTELAEERGDSLRLVLNGSTIALRDFADGKFDCVLVAVTDEGQLPSGYTSYPLGFQVSYVVVNSRLPIQEINTAQLRGIFGSGAGGSLSRWGELGISGSWSSRRIDAVALRDSDSLSFELFRYKVLDGSPPRVNLRYTPTEQAIWDILDSNENAIAILPYVPAGGRVKALSVSAAARGSDMSFSYSPNIDNVMAGNYPLVLRYYVIMREEQREALRPYLQRLYGDSLSGDMPRKGFVPLPVSERRNISLSLSQ